LNAAPGSVDLPGRCGLHRSAFPQELSNIAVHGNLIDVRPTGSQVLVNGITASIEDKLVEADRVLVDNRDGSLVNIDAQYQRQRQNQDIGQKYVHQDLVIV
jgi:hypothetical protein